MSLFGMTEFSPYCGKINSMADVCSIYQNCSRLLINDKNIRETLSPCKKTDEHMLVEQLANLAIEFNSGGTDRDETLNIGIDDNIVDDIIANDEKKNNMEIIFDCDKFYNFMRYNMRNGSVGNMLQLMKESINKSRDKKRVVGSTTDLQKVKSLNGRWFQRTKDNLEDLSFTNSLERDCIFEKNGQYFRVLSIFKKSYGRWRHVRSGNMNDNLKVHVQELKFYQMGFSPEPNYSCTTSSEIGHYCGHALELVF